MFHELCLKGKCPQNQDPAVAYFYSAAELRSRGLLWSIFALALIERVEHAMLRLARQCGMDAAESRVERVGGKDVLMVKRFDRTRSEDRSAYLRSRMISALTVLRADDAVSVRERWSHVLLVEEIRRVAPEPKKAARELFRRMAFNALISNTDDHPRNHALIAPGRDWMLSPAYDLTPTPSLSRERRDLATECRTLGRYANRANILSEHRRFLLEREEAERILDDMMKQVANTWEETVLSCGGSQYDVEAIRPAFVYPGYSL